MQKQKLQHSVLVNTERRHTGTRVVFIKQLMVMIVADSGSAGLMSAHDSD